VEGVSLFHSDRDQSNNQSLEMWNTEHGWQYTLQGELPEDIRRFQ
jgi:hypothetical protein